MHLRSPLAPIGTSELDVRIHSDPMYTMYYPSVAVTEVSTVHSQHLADSNEVRKRSRTNA